MAKNRLSFFTGFPGFIGRRLVRELLARDKDARVAALVEPRMRDVALEVAAGIDPERIDVIAGDIGERRLGLGDDEYDRLAAEVGDAYHLAAIYDLSVPLELAQRVNVEGTANVLELLGRAKKLERFNYVSTAYVAGDRTGVVYEHELSLGQRFKNHYESTKFQAELWVREWMDRVPTTIYRPAIVVGDSRTGETQKFDGPYYMLRVISRSVRMNQPIPQFGRSAAPFNVVPVDFVIEAMLAASGDPEAVNATLHLVDPEPVPAADVLDLLSRTYAGRSPGYRLPPGLVASSLRFEPVRALFGGAPRESIRYLNHPVRFDTRTASDVLSRHDLRCPRFPEYVEAMVRFFKENEDDPSFVSGAKSSPR
jgi:thioester reductase-like protein